MKSKTDEDRDLATPPYFKSWKSIYLLVLGVMVVVISVLYVFSNVYG